MAACLYLLLSLSIFVYVDGNTNDHGQDVVPNNPYDLLLEHAMKEYKKKNHELTATLLNEAIQDYKYVQEISAQCWIKCQAEFSKTKLRYISILDGQLNYLHYSIKMKACSKLCKEKFLGERKEVNAKTKDFFKQKEPYKFLHYSYTKIGSLDKALASAYTYLEVHPDNTKMAENVRNLKLKTGTLALQSLDEPAHITLYRQGEQAYFSRNYTGCIDYLEESHMLFFKEIEKCVGRCEEQIKTNDMFYSNSLYEHYRKLIACRQTCRHELTTGSTDTPSDKFVPLYYDFLQFSYWQEKKPLEAASLALTYLYLVPDDEKMKGNMKFYKSKPGVRGKLLKPRQQAVKFYRQLSLESSLIIIAKALAQPGKTLSEKDKALEELATEEMQNVHQSVLHEISVDKGPAKGDMEARKAEDEKVPTQDAHRAPRAYRNQGRWRKNPELNNVTLLMEESELNGTNRVAFDNLVDEETCQKLKILVQSIAVGGDGYQHSHKDASHPFTEKEVFTGITVGKAVEAYEEGRAGYNDVSMYFNISEKMRLLTQEYFGLDRLNIAYTHLVCREALPDLIDEDQEHISHPVHSDNCNVNADGPGTCPKRSPAYTWRDYSALLYLNDDFTGGDFIFADYNNQISARLKPTCGRMVAFQSDGIKNLHGVLGVKSGIRCALPIWFTLSDVSEDNRAKHEKRLEFLKPQNAQGRNEL